MDEIRHSSREGRVQIAVTEHPCWLMSFFRGPTRAIYEGFGHTVWHRFPTGERAGTLIECELAAFAERARMQGFYPRGKDCL